MTAFLDRWIARARQLSRVAVWAGGALMLASALLVSVEVVVRKGFAVSLGGADELSGYAFAIGTSWSLAFTLLQRANVRVDTLYCRLDARLRACCDALALGALALFVGVLTWHAVQVLASSLQYNSRATTPLSTPLWIPQGLWVAGFGLFLFALVPLLLRTVLAISAGDLAAAQRLGGARTLAEEAAQELTHAQAAKP